MRGDSAYKHSYARHDIQSLKRMSIREGEGDVAELYVRKAMERFGKTARENWEKSGAAGR